MSFYGTVGNDEAGRGLKEKLYNKWGLKSDSVAVDIVSLCCAIFLCDSR